MKRFIWNVVFSLLIIGALIYFIIIRCSPSYETTMLSKFDHGVQALIAAILFLLFLFILVKPSIKIASSIAQIPETAGSPSHLRIKIVNYSLFAAYDLNVYVYKKTRINLSGSDIKSSLLGHYMGREKSVSYLQSGLKALFESTRTNAAQLKFSSIKPNSDDEIKEILNSENSYLEIHVVIRHGLSGLEGNYLKRYDNIMSIRSGFYKHGFSSNVHTNNM